MHSPADPLDNRNVLVTGGTGAFGRAFVQYALDQGARRVIVFSRGESAQAAMRAAFHEDDRLRFFIGDVRDLPRLRDAMRDVEICVHAAALKRVEACEQDPSEAVATNIVGTQNVARAAIECGVARAIFLSTDKAANPATLYGVTKLAAERLWIGSNIYAAGTGTRLSATRYGNVLGSTGSILPLWRHQFERGEPLVLTDAAATRFWMPMRDAVALVTLALHTMRGGEVFVPRLGAAPILDLARAVVERAGPYAAGHVEIGLRGSEKLHEELVTREEARRTFMFPTHYVIEPVARLWGAATPPSAPLVPPRFQYRSNHAEPLTVADLRDMIDNP